MSDTPTIIRRWCACLLLCLLAAPPLAGQQPSGAWFMRFEPGSRARAMGGAFTALATSANGMHYNPAGLGFGISRELMLMHAEWLADLRVENATLFLPVTPRWGLSGAVSMLHTPSMTRYLVDPAGGGPLESGRFDAWTMVAGMSAGARLTRALALGVTAKWYRETLDAVTGQSVAADVGILLGGSGPLRFGAAVQNMGPPVRVGDGRDPLPLTVRVGAALVMPRLGVTVAVDGVRPRAESWRIHPGVEWNLGNSLFLRGGYAVAERLESGASAGLGLRLPGDHHLNYVYVPYGDLGETHRAEVVIHLGTATLPRGGYVAAREGRRSAALSPSPAVPSADGTAGAAPAEGDSLRTGAIVTTVTGDSDTGPPPPSDLTLVRLNTGQLELRWAHRDAEAIAYHIYARKRGDDRWQQVTASPLARTSQVFARRKNHLALEFAVTAVADGVESVPSTPVTLPPDTP